MQRKSPQVALICPICQSPVILEQWSDVMFDNGHAVHVDCFTEYWESELERQELG